MQTFARSLLFGGMTLSICSCLAAEEQSRRVCSFSHSLIESDLPISGEVFEIGDVELGQEILVQLDLRNQSRNEIGIVQGAAIGELSAKLIGNYKSVKPNDSVLVEATIQIPKDATFSEQRIFLPLTLRNGVVFRAVFQARVRGITLFRDPLFVFRLPQADPKLGKNSQIESFEIPLVLSELGDLEQVEVDADPVLSKIRFTKNLKDGRVRGEFSSSDLDSKGFTGKLRLKSRGQVSSETTLKVKRMSDLQVFPDVLYLKYDAIEGALVGQVLVRTSLPGKVMQNIDVDAELASNSGKVRAEPMVMSDGIARIRVRMVQTDSVDSEELILLKFAYQNRTHEEILDVVVIK